MKDIEFGKHLRYVCSNWNNSESPPPPHPAPTHIEVQRQIA